MVTPAATTRKLLPGTTGWSAEDLQDPEIERQWDSGRYEIIDGILVQTPAAYLDHGEPLPDLLVIVRNHLRAAGRRCRITVAADLVTPWGEVFRVDGVLMTAQDEQRQREALRDVGEPLAHLGRLRVPPTLAIESVSQGHADHDRKLKLDRYARFGIPNYWIVDHTVRSLECFRLVDQAYQLDTAARREGFVQPSAMPNLTLRLEDIFP